MSMRIGKEDYKAIISKVVEAAYLILYMVPISAIATLLIGPYFGVPRESKLGCVVAVGIVSVVSIIRSLSKRLKVMGIGACLASLVALFFVLGEERRQLIYENYSWLWIIGVFSVASILIGFAIFRNKWIRRLVSFGAFGTLLGFMIAKETISKAAVSIFLVLIFISVLEEIQLRWKKSGDTDVKAHVVWTSGFIIILSLLVFATPAPNKPYDWKFAKIIWEKTVTGLKKLHGNFINNEEYRTVGFSANSSFENRVNDNKKEVLYVQLNNRDIKLMYLAGITSEDFNLQNGWTTDITDDQYGCMMDAIETNSAVYQFDDSGRPYNYIKHNILNVQSLLYNTRYIFKPSKMTLTNTFITEIPYIESANNIYSEDFLKYGAEYSSSFYELNFLNPDVIEMLDKAEPISEASWSKTAKQMLYARSSSYSYDRYLEYREKVYEYYTDTYGLSDEAKALLVEIIGDADTEFDKLRRIENYFEGYSYTTNVRDIPETVVDASDFMDYFMLETNEGYCTYFATAFVLLARECGYPARYVQGYDVNSVRGGRMLVTESNAHAWAEVYFDNVGWVTFDATPGRNAFIGWEVSDEVQVDTSAALTVSVPVAELPGNVTPALKPNAAPEPSPAEEVEELPQEESAIDFVIIVIPLLAAVGVFVLLFAISTFVAKYKYKKLTDDKKADSIISGNLKMLKNLGYPIARGETLSEYKDRLNQLSDAILNKEALVFIPYYEKKVYSDIVFDSEAINEMEKSKAIIIRALKNHRWFYKILYWNK